MEIKKLILPNFSMASATSAAIFSALYELIPGGFSDSLNPRKSNATTLQFLVLIWGGLFLLKIFFEMF